MELSIQGHAFEARLYAEDVAKRVLARTGTLKRHLAVLHPRVVPTAGVVRKAISNQPVL